MTIHFKRLFQLIYLMKGEDYLVYQIERIYDLVKIEEPLSVKNWMIFWVIISIISSGIKMSEICLISYVECCSIQKGKYVQKWNLLANLHGLCNYFLQLSCKSCKSSICLSFKAFATNLWISWSKAQLWYSSSLGEISFYINIWAWCCWYFSFIFPVCSPTFGHDYPCEQLWKTSMYFK